MILIKTQTKETTWYTKEMREIIRWRKRIMQGKDSFSSHQAMETNTPWHFLVPYQMLTAHKPNQVSKTYQQLDQSITLLKDEFHKRILTHNMMKRMMMDNWVQPAMKTTNISDKNRDNSSKTQVVRWLRHRMKIQLLEMGTTIPQSYQVNWVLLNLPEK